METLEKKSDPKEEYKSFTHTVKVRWVDLDENGHVNNGVYQSYFDEARRAAFAETDLSLNDLRSRNIGPVILKAELEYKAELKYPETARLVTRFEAYKGSRVLTIQDLYRESDGALVCSAKFYALFMDLKRMRPYKVSEEEANKLSYKPM
ncbi:acyl-CoA thioesterase [Leptospira gomenensis]|uniref:Acyl-CoA thioesterase n=1 Tax=Leptospira gomenensis TaxID=2484974 RepID=A0A5F1Y9H4_9LEPT|nr:acyl-CoA thioesterase [Leptospira gomenensis]TGK32380.1 acyl-CoA thioesterase [Leptospira gomenensis]TGK43976.1 acyl-CoA thioesterase [Leptospira gomenensis]TGK48947.1 acyl-CoA thioesterase [Leptospira gomenensis]TGK54658.1 acyl-CoA thioesterase [Leptospira gomenensis]